MSDKTDYETINSCIECDAETGLFRRKIRTNNRCKHGWFGGANNLDGYKSIGISNRIYKAHRLIWLLTYGEWPKDQLDHIDGDKSNNRLNNLREATSRQNQQNKRISKNNKSGVKGVSWDKATQKWMAIVKVNGRPKYLGCFFFLHHAKEAVEKFRMLHHGEFANHG